MAQYSPELLAALRQRYEQTDQPMHALAAEFRIGITTLQSLVRKNGWSPRSQRLRHCPPVLAAPLPPADAGVDLEVIPTHEVTPSPILSLARGGSEAVLADNTIAPAPAAGNEPALSTLSPAERLEALVEKEIAAEEATRAALGIRPRSRNEAERCARTIVKLTHALQTIQKLRGGDRAGAREPPVDLEALRAELARRLNGLIDARKGSERAALDRQIARLTDNEVKELIALGRERGMPALLRPAEKDAGEPA